MIPVKSIFITGCSSGLGFATVLKLIQSGHIVYATVRSLDSKASLEKACNNSKNLFVFQVDLSDNNSIEKVADLILSKNKFIDSVIFNAASTILGPPDSTSPDEVEYLFKVNVFSILRLVQLFLPQMREKRKGHLIFISSISGIESSGFLGVYAATKFALEALVDSWATTLHKWDIKTTIIEPGAMNTNLPNSTSIGSYYNSKAKDDPYKNFNEQSLNFLKNCLQQGADPASVAELIIEILNNPSPSLRYQTCAYSKNLVKRHRCDPEGKSWVEEHRQFLENFH